MVLIFHSLLEQWRIRIANIERLIAAGSTESWRLGLELRVLNALVRRYGQSFDTTPPRQAEPLSAYRSAKSSRMYLSKDGCVNVGATKRLSAIVKDPGAPLPQSPGRD